MRIVSFLGLTVLLVLAISPAKSDRRDLVTRVSKSFSLVRRVRGRVSSSSKSGYVNSHSFRKNRKLREKLRQKDIRNIRPTETSSSPIISTSALTTPDPFSTSTYLTSISSPVPERRPQSKYKSAEANYLALRRKNNNYKARQYTSTSTTPAPKQKRSIKDEVGDMINQLRHDLENLLKFNENLLHFNSSIVKKAVKSKVETFFSTVSTAIDSQHVKNASTDSVAAAEDILHVTEDIGRTMASTLELDTSSEIQLANISMLVMKKRLGQEAVSKWNSLGVKVELPDQETISNNNETVSLGFTSYNNLGAMMSDSSTGGNIRSPVLSVNVLDNAHQSLKRSIPLTKPIEFVIQHKSIKRVRKRKCTYWEFKHAKWSSDGCYTIRKRSSSTTTACQCYHLTNFAIAVELEQDNDISEQALVVTSPPSSSPRLVSWEYLQYFSAQPSVTDARQFGDRIVTAKTSTTSTTSSQFQVYRATTESLPLLNSRIGRSSRGLNI